MGMQDRRLIDFLVYRIERRAERDGKKSLWMVNLQQRHKTRASRRENTDERPFSRRA